MKQSPLVKQTLKDLVYLSFWEADMHNAGLGWSRKFYMSASRPGMVHVSLLKAEYCCTHTKPQSSIFASYIIVYLS